MTGCLPEAEKKKKIEKKRRGWINLLAGRASAVVRIRAAAYFFSGGRPPPRPRRIAPRRCPKFRLPAIVYYFAEFLSAC
jgi:hypothetical protein